MKTKKVYKVSWSNSQNDYYSNSFNSEEERKKFIGNLSTKNIQTWENEIIV